MSIGKEEFAEHFERAAATYEETFPFMGDFARHALTLLPPMGPDSVFHDNACGPGIVSPQILALPASGQPGAIHATDFSPAMIRALKAKPALADKVTAEVMDAAALTFADETFTHSATNFAMMGFSRDDAKKVTGHLYRTLKAGGAAEVSTWSSFGYLTMMQEVIDVAKPGAKVPPNLPIPDFWKEESTLVDALVGGGFDRDKIVVSQMAADVGGNIWGTPGTQSMTDMLGKGITAGWTEDETAAYYKAWTEKIEEEKKNPKMYPMVAHLAVARK